MMTKKPSKQDQIQQGLVDAYIQSEGTGILLATMRSGKCRIGIKIMKELHFQKVLIVYPNGDIRSSWEKEFEVFPADVDVNYTTYLSLHKHLGFDYDLVIFDEVDQTSDNQRASMRLIMEDNPNVLGLTGTLSAKDKEDLQGLGLKVIASYTRENAIEDRIVTDYKIGVLEVPLDTQQLIYKNSKGVKMSEKKKFDSYTWVIDKMVREGKNPFFMRLNRMRIIHNSVAKKDKCKKVLQQLKDKRVLVFTGSKKSAESLGIPFYHSTSDKDTLEKFKNGEINHLAVCKLLSAGVTIPQLEYVILQAFDSNSSKMEQRIARAARMDFALKVAKIYVISSSEQVEKKWLEKALKGFDKSKIQHII